MAKNEKQKMTGQKAISFLVAALLTIALSLSTATAQESVNPAGGNASGIGGTSNYTIGQVAYQTHSDTGGTLAEGVQHPFEIWVVTSIDEAIGITLNVSVYPNPTKNFLTLEVKDFEPTGLSYLLFDMSGKILQDKQITDTHTSIDMTQLVPAVYFVRVIQLSKEVKTFKVIKN